MPPVRHSPSQRVHDRVIPTGATLQPTAETSSPFGTARERNSSQKQHLSLVWNGHQVTPAAHYLLSNSVDPSLLHNFSPIHIHDSSRIFDPSSGLPLPPKPYASSVQVSIPTQLTHRATSAPSDPSLLVSPASSATPSLTLPPSTSKPHAYPSTSPPTTTEPSSIVRTYQPSAQPPRPPNNFVLFRADYFARVKSLHLFPHLRASLPKDYDQWYQAPDTVKTYYREVARLTKEVHARLHPGYKYKPLKKDERQRQKDEQARLKRETMAKAKASKTDKPQAKSSTTHVADPASPPTRNAVDFRIYDPARRSYHRHYSSRTQSPAPLPLRPLPLFSPSASSPPPAPNGVRSTTQLHDADRLPPSSSPRTTSPASTLFQGDDIESPRFNYAYCTTYEDADKHESNTTVALWPTIEDDVDWYQVAPSHWCGPDNHRFCDEDACDNCLSASWSDELHINIPTASATPNKHDSTRPGYNVALDPTLRVHSLHALSSETLSFANNSHEALLASAMEAAGDGTMDRFWIGLFVESRYDLPPLPCHSLAPPTIYNERA